MTTTRPGLILFAHGARDPQWAQPFTEVARRIRASNPGLPVALAYLELMSPTLQEAGRQLAGEGCSHVTVVPLFLGAGGHVRRDLPRLLDELAGLHAGVTWRASPAVGEVDSVVQAMADAALAQLPAPRPGPTDGTGVEVE